MPPAVDVGAAPVVDVVSGAGAGGELDAGVPGFVALSTAAEMKRPAREAGLVILIQFSGVKVPVTAVAEGRSCIELNVVDGPRRTFVAPTVYRVTDADDVDDEPELTAVGAVELMTAAETYRPANAVGAEILTQFSGVKVPVTSVPTGIPWTTGNCVDGPLRTFIDATAYNVTAVAAGSAADAVGTATATVAAPANTAAAASALVTR